jgi:ubiquitin C-terminal hydrolase
MNKAIEYSGLYNHGNFCYVNSILQALFLTPTIIKGLITDEEHEKDIMYLELINSIKDIKDLELDKYKKEDITIERIKFLKIYFSFKQLIIKLMKKEEKVIDPKDFILECHKIRNDELFSGVQNDAQEFLLFLLDNINEAKGIKKELIPAISSIEECQNVEDKLSFLSDTSLKQHYTNNNYSWVVNSIFYQIITVMKCNKCPNYSLKFEPYRELPIEIPDIKKDLTIYDCFDNFFGKEQFSKGEEWHCDKCDNKEGNFKQYRIVDFPETLIIFFKRYKVLNMTGTRIKKITTKIEFPFQLNMNKYKIMNKEQDTQYDLYSVINQTGTFNGGHYFTYSRNLNSDIDTSWYEFNDSHVSKINDSDIVTSNAYILFYKKK